MSRIENIFVTQPSSEFATVLAGSGDTQSYVDASSLNGTYTYYYWVEASTDGTNSAAAGPVSASLSYDTPVLPAAPMPEPVTGISAQLTINAATDPTGNSDAMSYSWSLESAPSGANVQLFDGFDTSVNAIVTTATTLTATFTQGGTYYFLVVASDTYGQSNPVSVPVTVVPTLTTITVSPIDQSIPLSTSGTPSTEQFTAAAYDQFSIAMAMPSGLGWSLTGDGSIGASSGLYTAPTDGQSATITATVSDVSSEVVLLLQQAVTFNVASTDEIDLSWNAVAGASQYEIYRDVSADFTPSEDNLLSVTDTNAWNDEGLPPNTTAYYQVYAVNADNTLTLAAAGSAATLDADITPSGTINPPANFTVVPLNDLEMFLYWAPSTVNQDGFEIQISQDDTEWQPVTTVWGGLLPGATYMTYTVRGYGTGDAYLLQEGAPYYFRIEAVAGNASNGTIYYNIGGWATTGSASYVKEPQFDNTIVIVAGFGQNEAALEQSWWASPNQGYSVGSIWKYLVDQGYNVFMSAEPSNEIGTSSLPITTGGVVNWDGSGELATEVEQEMKLGYGNIGLVGYSHGGGVIYSMSQFLANYVASNSGSNYNIAESDVVFVGTIDAVERDPLDLHPPSPLQESPGVFWPVSLFGDIDPIDVNYWEPNGAPAPWWLGGNSFPPPYPIVLSDTHGIAMYDAQNYEFDLLNHTNIDDNLYVLTSIENWINYAFFELSL